MTTTLDMQSRALELMREWASIGRLGMRMFAESREKGRIEEELKKLGYQFWLDEDENLMWLRKIDFIHADGCTVRNFDWGEEDCTCTDLEEWSKLPIRESP